MSAREASGRLRLGRPNSCLSVSNEDLTVLRPAMAIGRLIFAAH